MRDLIRDAARRGAVIFHEEVARDGAQGKTLLSGEQRAAVAQAHSGIFRGNANKHLVFNAGFPSAGREEFNAVRAVVERVQSCYLAVAGRVTRADIDLMIQAIDGARYGRLYLIMPVSEAMCAAMMHLSPKDALRAQADAVRYAAGKAGGIPVDVAFADVSRAEAAYVAEAAVTLTQAGAAMTVLCDTVGSLFPGEAFALFKEIQTRAAGEADFVAHMHNDLGFGLMNTLEALRAGLRGLTSSWLGLGERTGLAATEQLLFALGYQPELLLQRLGIAPDLWFEAPDLKGIVPVARYVSQATGVALATTDPIVGAGVNTISTGTPFVDPRLFSPFDAESVLGVPRQVLLTPLASKRVIAAKAEDFGFELNDEEMTDAVLWVKSECHARGVPVIQDADFAVFIRNLLADRPVKGPSRQPQQDLLR
jgi:2-isopropylmalate synthase